MKSVPVKIRPLSPTGRIPTYATDGAAAFDLYAAEDTIIGPGETKKVPLGFAVEIPPGYEMQIRPRSGISLNTKLRVANAPGTVDSDYRGEVVVIIDNIAEPHEVHPHRAVHVCLDGTAELALTARQPTYKIRSSDRIAQAVIVPVPRVKFVETDEELAKTGRGCGGFSSSGISLTERDCLVTLGYDVREIMSMSEAEVHARLETRLSPYVTAAKEEAE
ncbi:dUTP diphosphatase [Paenibacillus sp. NPDC057967]|uniref:dUTP diphosphatase n=1 Tax=Paenibacillus sp. NPDC057967 TaxID=3346293 RepID=UPI0036DA22DD